MTGASFSQAFFFVLGFSLVFSIVGVLLQTVLSSASYTVSEWLGRLGGVIIILFGFFLLGLFTPAFLKRDHKILIKRRFRSHYLTSFVFGAAFAVGWTPAFPRPWAPFWRLPRQRHLARFCCSSPIRLESNSIPVSRAFHQPSPNTHQSLRQKTPVLPVFLRGCPHRAWRSCLYRNPLSRRLISSFSRTFFFL